MAKRWMMLGLVVLVASPLWAKRTAAKQTEPTDARTSAQDYQLADQFFRSGLQFETMSDEEFAAWVRTSSGAGANMNVGYLDSWRDRRLHAIECYTNSIQLNPADWRPHKRLGLLYNNLGGTISVDERSMLELVAYIALKPTDLQPDGTDMAGVAKDIIDRQLRQYEDLQSTQALASVLLVHALLIDRDHGLMAKFQGLVAALQQFTAREVFGGFTSAALLKPGVFTQADSLRVAEHQCIEGVWEAMPDTANTLPVGETKDLPDEQKAVRGLQYAVLASADFVPSYLSILGQTQAFSYYLDLRHVSYDPRPLQMLTGEAAKQLRLGFLRLPAGAGAGRVRDEAARYSALGGVSPLDLWSDRDFTKPLPDWFMNAGQMPEPEKDKGEFEALRSMMALGVPGGYIVDKDDPKVWPSESGIAAADMGSFEAYKGWLMWRNIHLQWVADLLGYRSAADLLLADYSKVGAGELSTWAYGRLAPPRKMADLTGDRRWVMAQSN
jgi:hypothetical protein